MNREVDNPRRTRAQRGQRHRATRSPRRAENIRFWHTASSHNGAAKQHRRPAGTTKNLQAQAQRLVNAIAKSGDSPSLLSGLAEVESALGQLDQQLKMQSPIDLEGTLVEIREFVSKNLFQLRAFLAGDPTLAKSALTKNIKQLVLTPVQLPTGPVFEVSGNVEPPTLPYPM
jgi:hypothetical protein